MNQRFLKSLYNSVFIQPQTSIRSPMYHDSHGRYYIIELLSDRDKKTACLLNMPWVMLPKYSPLIKRNCTNCRTDRKWIIWYFLDTWSTILSTTAELYSKFDYFDTLPTNLSLSIYPASQSLQNSSHFYSWHNFLLTTRRQQYIMEVRNVVNCGNERDFRSPWLNTALLYAICFDDVTFASQSEWKSFYQNE